MPLPEDTRDVYSRLEADLKKSIPNSKLSPEQKELLRKMLEFGYAAAFSERTCDMNQSWFQADRYRNGYKNMQKLLE
jgi:hypothetical protein